MIDNRSQWFPEDNQRLVASLCLRRLGIGADGLICLRQDPNADFKMVYFNADGEEGSLCGNGSRCAVAFAKKLGIVQDKKVQFQAFDGLHHAIIENDHFISLQLANAKTIQQKGNDWIIDTGSPHFLRFCDDVKQIDVLREGRKIRNLQEYAQEGINVNFIERHKSQAGYKMRTYERGVEAETYSCGTGAVAAAIAVHLANNPARNAHGHFTETLSTLSGPLQVRFQRNGQTSIENIWLEGSAIEVFTGQINMDE